MYDGEIGREHANMLRGVPGQDAREDAARYERREAFANRCATMAPAYYEVLELASRSAAIREARDERAAEVALLARACRVLDTLSDIDRQLAREGLVVRGCTGQPRAHPLVGSMAELSRTLECLVRGMCLPQPWEEQGSRRSPQQREAAQARWRRTRGQMAE